MKASGKLAWRVKGWLSFLFTDLGEIRFKNHKFTTVSGHTSIISLTRDVIKLQNSTEDIDYFQVMRSIWYLLVYTLELWGKINRFPNLCCICKCFLISSLEFQPHTSSLREKCHVFCNKKISIVVLKPTHRRYSRQLFSLYIR